MANLITQTEAARRLGISKKTLQQWGKKKVVTVLRADDATRTVRYDANEIDQLFKAK